MSNLFRGAMNFIGASDVAGGGGGVEQGRLVGQRIEVEGQRFNVKAQIAQGGFATVYTCQEASAAGRWFALKSQYANDEAAVRQIKGELQLLRSLNHPHILQYVSSAVARGTNGAKEFLLITELCSGGSVIDMLTAGAQLTLAQITNIMHGATAAIAYLHARPTPVTHRDMKVENLLISSRGLVKLCDFGSATTEEFQPDHDWTPGQRTKLEEDFQRATTPMYRAPEILDTYLGYPVGRLQDVWALGCVLFYMCHRSHPFEDSAKLRIIYAKYAIPEADERYAAFRPLIDSTLKPDPRQRPSAAELQQRLEVLAVALEVRVDTAVPGVDTTQLTGGEQIGETTRGGGGERRGDGGAAGGERRQPAAAAAAAAEEREPAAGQPGSSSSSTAFSALRGQGLSMFRNLKEKSAAVMHTVQNTYGSKGPEMVWLTSRVCIVPQLDGIPEPLAAQAEETLRNALAATRRPFKMINLGSRRLRCEYPEAVVDVSFPAEGGVGGPAPSIDCVLSVAHAAGIYLRQQPSDAFIVVLGSEVHSSLAALALLVYHRLVPKPWCAIELLQERRPSTTVFLPPSSHRLLDALHRSVQPGFGKSIADVRLQLESLVVEHLPAFNNNRSGCRPLLMVYVGGTALWTPHAYETLRSYEGAAERKRAQFGLNRTLVHGDVAVVLYHARMSSLTQRMTQIPMISFSLHTALVQPGATSIELRKGDLDYAAAEEQAVPEEIRVTLHYSVSPSSSSSSRPSSSTPGAPRGFLDYPADIVAPRHVVASREELEEIQAMFGSGGSNERKQRQPARPAAAAAAPADPAPQPAAASTGFFDTLAWDTGSSSSSQAPPPPPHRATAAAPAAAAAAAAPPPRHESMMVDTASLETPILGGSTSPNNRSMTDALLVEEVDLLGIHSATPAKPAAAAASRSNADLLFDPFESTPASSKAGPQTLDDLFGGPPLAASSSSSLNNNPLLMDDLLGGFGGGAAAAPAASGRSQQQQHGGDLLMGDLLGGGGGSMHRNASAPSFPAASAAAAAKKKDPFDPFADFLAANPEKPTAASGSSATSTRSNTPSMQQQQQSAARPNYSRSAFDNLNPTGMPAKPKSSANCFDDLLSSSGFTSTGSSGAGGAGRTMGDMRRAEEIRDLTEDEIKIRDWTAGKERNIRALLASLSEVLWADAPRWEQPSMASLLTANEVKRAYRKAAVVVHPDKQTGLPHAELAKAIMIELNDAWSAFEEAGSPSLG